MKLNTTSTIPTVDLSRYTSVDSSEQNQFCRQLCDACHDIGFFYLENHGIHPSLLNDVLTQSKRFFDLPQDEKDKIDISQSPHFRGYGKLNAEITKGIPDYKETYDLGLEKSAHDSPHQSYLRLHGPNQWSASLEPAFSHVMQSYINQMMQLGEKIMLAISQGLGIDDQQFQSSFDIHSDDAYAMLRLLHYPPSRNNKFGVGPHVDAGCLVFLLQDETGGLQVQKRNGDWIDAPPIKNSFIVNIGEMLQVWTNQYFIATPHRVLNSSDKCRISAPFFFEPNLSANISPISIFGKPVADHPIKINYGEHMLKVFKRSFEK